MPSALFGELRCLLHAPAVDHHELFDLLAALHGQSPRSYQERCLPYLAAFPQLWEEGIVLPAAQLQPLC